MSIHAFRNALDSLVAQTEKRSGKRVAKARANGISSMKARQNMAVRLLGDGSVEADTVDELLAYQRKVGVRSKTKAPAARRVEASPRRAEKPAKAQRKGIGHIPAERHGGPPTHGQGRAIGNSIGGFEAYCPGSAAQFREQKLSHAQVLYDMGLTLETASAVCDAMSKAGVLGFNREGPKMALAQQILTEVGGVQCPVARSNPRSRRW